MSFYVSLEISPPRGLSLEGLETSLTLGAQQGPLQKCPAIGAHVQEHAEESRLSSDVRGEAGQTVEGKVRGTSFIKHLLCAASSTMIPTRTQQSSPLCAKFTNGKTESQKELEASMRQAAMMETNYRGTSRVADSISSSQSATGNHSYVQIHFCVLSADCQSGMSSFEQPPGRVQHR